MPAVSRHDWMLAWVSLVTAATSLTAGLNARFETELGISMPEQDLLKQLAMAGGRIKMRELAQRVFLSKAGVTKMVDRLEKRGLLRRVPSKTDRRVISAVLTGAGKDVVRQSWEILGPWVESNFRAHLSDREVLDLRHALRSLLRGLDLYDGMLEHLAGFPNRTE